MTKYKGEQPFYNLPVLRWDDGEAEGLWPALRLLEAQHGTGQALARAAPHHETPARARAAWESIWKERPTCNGPAA